MKNVLHRLLNCVPALTVALAFAAGEGEAQADDWTMAITVDNQYDIYFGDAYLTVPTFVGGDLNWPTVETWSITGVSSTAFLYVSQVTRSSCVTLTGNAKAGEVSSKAEAMAASDRLVFILKVSWKYLSRFTRREIACVITGN